MGVWERGVDWMNLQGFFTSSWLISSSLWRGGDGGIGRMWVGSRRMLAGWVVTWFVIGDGVELEDFKPSPSRSPGFDFHFPKFPPTEQFTPLKIEILPYFA